MIYIFLTLSLADGHPKKSVCGFERLSNFWKSRHTMCFQGHGEGRVEKCDEMMVTTFPHFRILGQCA